MLAHLCETENTGLSLQQILRWCNLCAVIHFAVLMPRIKSHLQQHAQSRAVANIIHSYCLQQICRFAIQYFYSAALLCECLFYTIYFPAYIYFRYLKLFHTFFSINSFRSFCAISTVRVSKRSRHSGQSCYDLLLYCAAV